MRSIGQWNALGIGAALSLFAFDDVARAASFDVPLTHATLQAAVAAAAVSPDVDNVITISTSPVMTNVEVAIGAQFGATRQLVIKPADGLDRASIANNNPTSVIVNMQSAKYVTLQDLDILRNITNGQDLVVIDLGENILIQRCRIGSHFPTTGTAGWSNIAMTYPTEIIVRNSVIFANATGTFDYGINVTQMNDQFNSIRLYNNDVSDYKVYGIRIAAVAPGALVLLRNNVVVNHEDVVPEPVAYRTEVNVGPIVVSSHNVAFATAAFVQTGPGQNVAGTASAFLNLAKPDAASSFVTMDWDMMFDVNPDHFRLVDLGPLHDAPGDYGTTVTNVFPDIEVIDDLEGEYRPGGAVLHTDRGADQLEPGIAPTAVEPPGHGISLTSYPNPFNPSTALSFVIPYGQHVDLSIYDSSGRLIRALLDQALEPGPHVAYWDGKDDRGVGVASGVYFARLEVGAAVARHKLVLVR